MHAEKLQVLSLGIDNNSQQISSMHPKMDELHVRLDQIAAQTDGTIHEQLGRLQHQIDERFLCMEEKAKLPIPP